MDERPTNRPDRTDTAPPYLGGPSPVQAQAQVSERMQALLSRAVEDQMAEQRQLQALINEVRTGLAKVGSRTELLASTESVDALSSSVTALGKDIRGRIEDVGERLGAAMAALADDTESAALRARVDAVAETVEEQHRAIPGLIAQTIQGEAADTRQEIARLAQAVLGLSEATRTEIAALKEATLADAAEQTRKFTEYVDNAVLALAEVLLRPRAEAASRPPARPSTPSTPVATPAAPEPVVSAVVSAPAPVAVPQPTPEPVVAAAPEPAAPAEPAWSPPPAAVVEPRPAAVPAAAVDVPAAEAPAEERTEEERELAFTEWQPEQSPFRPVTPPLRSPDPQWAPPSTAPVAVDDDVIPFETPEEEAERKRTWWRPGG